MRPYQYKPLLDPSKEIRLINILPGKFEDPIRVTIRHAAFIPPNIEDSTKSDKISLGELRRTLPQDWRVRETPEGRYIFVAWDGSHKVTWTHPDPQFDSRLLFNSESDSVFEPEFEALSYVWGSVHTTETTYIYPNENDDENMEVQTLEIGTNLAAALQHLRLQDQPRIIWADAMAINQLDFNERNEQVKIMGHIYRHAHRVVVWLGPEADNSDIALSALEAFGYQVETSKDEWYFASPDATDRDMWRPRVPLPWNQIEHAAVLALVQRPWFERLWTVPEIQLANNLAVVQCGSRQLLWSWFRRALHVAEQKVNLNPDFRARCSSINRSVVSRTVPVASVLSYVSRERECSEPRDKLYAILGLIGPIFAAKIQPEYSISIPKIYQDFLTTHVEVSQRLDLLPLVTIRSELQHHNTEPSWTPDWNSGETSDLEIQFYHFAASVSKAQVRYPQHSVLEVTGIRTTTISNLSEILTANIEEIIEDIGIHKISADAEYVTEISLMDAYIRTLCCDDFREKFPDNLSAPTLNEVREDILSGLRDLSYNHKDKKLRRSMIQRKLSAIYRRRKKVPKDLARNQIILDRVLRFTLWERLRFLTTTDGFIGLAPFNTETGKSNLLRHVHGSTNRYVLGDVVSILLGCYMPMVLRPTSDGNFKVVGPCFILGLMEGEALLGPIPSPWIAQYGNFDREFLNKETNEITDEDPRLGSLPPEWEPLEVSRTKDDPIHYAYFRNKKSGEVMNSDPRLLPEALEKRGVKLDKFCLI